MVENMFFLDSKYLGMVGMPAPHPPPSHPNKKDISIDRGETISRGGIPPVSKSVPVSLKTFLTCERRLLCLVREALKLKLKLRGSQSTSHMNF